MGSVIGVGCVCVGGWVDRFMVWNVSVWAGEECGLCVCGGEADV